MKRIWGSAYRRQLDYVSCWFLLGFRYVKQGGARAAFVATNSVSQGEQVATIWKPMLDAGIEIDFAHRTFKWTSEARGKAAVHVVIVGFSLVGPKKRKALFDYADVQSEPVERVAKHINPYLVEYADVLVERASKPLSPAISECRYGNKPSDNGHLVVEPGDRPSNDPIADKYLRRYVGAKELLHGNERWCLWLVNAPPHHIQGSKFIKDRVAKVREYRASSSAEDTQKAAEHPQRFFRIPQPSVGYIAIPRHVSATRRWFTVSHFDKDTIASDALFTAIDPDGFLFGILSSAMWISWLRTVGGQIKSDLRFSKEIVYNTFPLPVPTDSQRTKIVKAGEAVRAVRRKFPESSLADLYDPLSMPAPLLKAHRKLDQAVDQLFGFKGKSDTDRLRALFAAYAAMQPATLRLRIQAHRDH